MNSFTGIASILGAAACAVALSATPAAAQIKVGMKVGEPRVVEGGSYDSLGRRDPFVSLIQPRRAVTENAPRASHGLISFMVADIVVTGIARKGDTMFAIIQGADKQSYVARVNDKLADAVIKRIDAQGVVFLEVPKPGDTNKPQETRKVLRSAEVK